MSSRAIRKCLGFGLVIALSSGASAAASPPAVAGGSAAEEAPPGPRTWRSLTAVDLLSGTDGWAVGSRCKDPCRALIRHWNGTRWTTSPNHFEGALFDVAMVASDDVWAVGSYSPDPSQPWTSIHIVHWDGTRWSSAFAPPSDGGYHDLTNVGFVSANYVIATGQGCSQTDCPYPITVRWDGAEWTQTGGTNVAAVSAVSPTDAWAVGPNPALSAPEPVVRHWDGSRWTRVELPDLGDELESQLVAVDPVSSAVPSQCRVRGPPMSPMDRGRRRTHSGGVPHRCERRQPYRRLGSRRRIIPTSERDDPALGRQRVEACRQPGRYSGWLSGWSVCGIANACVGGRRALRRDVRRRLLLGWDGTSWTDYRRAG